MSDYEPLESSNSPRRKSVVVLGACLPGYAKGYGFRRCMRMAQQEARGGPMHSPAHHPRKKATAGRRRLFDEASLRKYTRLHAKYEAMLSSLYARAQ